MISLKDKMPLFALQKLWMGKNLYENAGSCDRIMILSCQMFYIQNKIQAVGCLYMPQDTDELKQYTIEKWENTSDQTVKNLICSMKLVIENDGNKCHIRFFC